MRYGRRTRCARGVGAFANGGVRGPSRDKKLEIRGLVGVPIPRGDQTRAPVFEQTSALQFLCFGPTAALRHGREARLRGSTQTKPGANGACLPCGGRTMRLPSLEQLYICLHSRPKTGFEKKKSNKQKRAKPDDQPPKPMIKIVVDIPPRICCETLLVVVFLRCSANPLITGQSQGEKNTIFQDGSDNSNGRCAFGGWHISMSRVTVVERSHAARAQQYIPPVSLGAHAVLVDRWLITLDVLNHCFGRYPGAPEGLRSSDSQK